MSAKLCPACGEMLDASFNFGGEAVEMAEGDFTICAFCTRVLRVSGNVLKVATAEDLKEAPPELKLLRQAVLSTPRPKSRQPKGVQ